MGLLSKLTGKVTPQKKPADDALLLHAMLLMCGADGSFDEQELPQVEGYFNALPEFEGKEFSNVYGEAAKVLKRFSSLKDSVKALSELSNQTVKNKCYLLAADIEGVRPSRVGGRTSRCRAVTSTRRRTRCSTRCSGCCRSRTRWRPRSSRS